MATIIGGCSCWERTLASPAPSVVQGAGGMGAAGSQFRPSDFEAIMAAGAGHSPVGAAGGYPSAGFVTTTSGEVAFTYPPGTVGGMTDYVLGTSPYSSNGFLIGSVCSGTVTSYSSGTGFHTVSFPAAGVAMVDVKFNTDTWVRIGTSTNGSPRAWGDWVLYTAGSTLSVVADTPSVPAWPTDLAELPFVFSETRTVEGEFSGIDPTIPCT